MTGAIWEFTPGTNTWLLKNAVLPVSRGYIPTLAVYDFKVRTYLIYTGGGSDWNGTTLVDTNDSFKYDPITDSISTIASIPRATAETRAVPWAGAMAVTARRLVRWKSTVIHARCPRQLQQQ